MRSCESCKFNYKAEHKEPCRNCIHNAIDNYKAANNLDKIRNMRDIELAELLIHIIKDNDDTWYSIPNGKRYKSYDIAIRETLVWLLDRADYEG